MPEQLQTVLALPVLGTTLKLLLLVVLLVFMRRGLRIIVNGVASRLEARVPEIDRRRRLDTLLRAGYGAATVVLVLVAATMALGLIGLNIVPVLASAGVVGLAISLGAQTLIKDYLGGIIILAEDQFRVGEAAGVVGVSGEVVRMTLRATYLRDLQGKLYAVPNGDIRTIANLTREWARAVVDLNLDHSADLSKAEQALQQAAERLAADPQAKSLLIGDVERVMWNDFSGWAHQVRLIVKTVPGQQFLVTRLLRRYAVEELQAAGLQLALPTTVVRSGEAKA
ncbi:MAG: mechanosensitive ion channel domain-containing protein [Anaerolineales bacterium]